MSDDGFETWLDRIDADRVRATTGGIAGGWVVVAVIAILIAVVPPAIAAVDVAFTGAKQAADVALTGAKQAADVALTGAKHKVAKVEHRLAQTLRPAAGHNPPC